VKGSTPPAKDELARTGLLVAVFETFRVNRSAGTFLENVFLTALVVVLFPFLLVLIRHSLPLFPLFAQASGRYSQSPLLRTNVTLNLPPRSSCASTAGRHDRTRRNFLPAESLVRRRPPDTPRDNHYRRYKSILLSIYLQF
jgi:hypothetical protein